MFAEMASRITLQVGRQVLRRSWYLPIRLLSTATPSTKLISPLNNRSLFNATRQSACLFHTSTVVSTSQIVTIQDEKDFDTRVLQSEKPVIVDFFATYVAFRFVAVCHYDHCGMLFIGVTTYALCVSSGMDVSRCKQTYTHTHIPWWAGVRKVKPMWILQKQETVSVSGISWTICKSAPRTRQITIPAHHHWVFLQAGCPSCLPTNSVKALKAIDADKVITNVWYNNSLLKTSAMSCQWN